MNIKNIFSKRWLYFIALAVFLFILHQSNFNVPFMRDEGEYAYSAQIMKQGTMPYENSFLQKPPMIIYTYYFAQIFSSSYWPPRILSYSFVFLTAILIFFIASRSFGGRAGIISMFFVPLLVLLPGFDQFSANTEMFLILPVAGLVALYVLKREKSSNWHWFLAGILAAISLFYKYNIILVLLFIFSVWIVDTWIKNKNIKEIIKKISFSFIGFLSASLLILGPFLLHDGGKTLWECTVKFNSYYAGSSNFGFSGIWYYLKLFFSKWWILPLFSIIFFIKRPKRWWFFAGLAVVALIESFGSWYGHYYILFVVFWSIIIAYSIDIFSDLISQNISSVISDGKGTKKIKANPVKVAAFLTVALVFMVMIPSAEFIFASKEKFSETKLGGENTFLEAETAAKKITETTSLEDYVLVAGSEAEILYYSKRQSATRFVIFYPLMIDTPLAASYQQEAIREIEAKKPKIIAYVNSYYSWTSGKDSPKIIVEYLDKLIKDEYQLIQGNEKENKILLYKNKLN